MKVPRPFDPDPEEVEKPQGKESQKHIEREEKPIADENQQQSEDFHGGNESTESLPDSPNEGSEEQEEQDQQNSGQSGSSSSGGQHSQSTNEEQSQQSNNGERVNESSTESSTEDTNGTDNKQSQSSSENSSQSESQQSQDSSEGQQSSSNENSTSNASETSDKQSSSDGKQGESQQSSGTTEGDNSSQSSSEQSEQPSQSSDSEESVDNEQRETSDSTSQESNGETSDSSSDLSEESDESDGTSDSEEQSDETSESEEEEVSDSTEESEVQVNSGTYNTDQVFTYTSAKNNTKLSRALYDFIEYVADETKVFNNLSADYYEPKKLMLRRYQGKSLNATKSGKVRETIVVLLDNSGSMQWVSEHVLEVAKALIQRHDAEIYFTPNGYVETQLTRQGVEQVKHENVINKIVSQQLKVLYVGDYDGANTPIELSWKTKVFWLCPESRYRRFRSHDWVSYDESAFRGFFARTYNANEMVQALKRFAGFAQFTRYWYDPHEREVFQDD